MIRFALAVGAALLLVLPAAAQGSRDGAHDFDFDLGRWHTQSHRLMHPLAHAGDWVDLDGETDVTPIWGGKGNLAEYKAQGSNGPLELIAIRSTTRRRGNGRSTSRGPA